VSVTPGWKKFVKGMTGSKAIIAKMGIDAATSHVPKLIFTTVVFPLNETADLDFRKVAVSHRADETLRLAIPQNMR